MPSRDERKRDRRRKRKEREADSRSRGRASQLGTTAPVTAAPSADPPVTAYDAAGVTASEKHLGRLCRHTFLNLWSYQNVFKEPGKELCDLLVIFGQDVLLFSDKHCALDVA